MYTWHMTGAGLQMGAAYDTLQSTDKSLERSAQTAFQRAKHQAVVMMQTAHRELCLLDSKTRMLLAEPEKGAATAEYAVVLIAATGFATVLMVLLKSDVVRNALTTIVQKALNVG